MDFSDDKILTSDRIKKLMEMAINANVGVKLSNFQTRELMNYIKRLEEENKRYDKFVMGIISLAEDNWINLE